MDERRPGPPGPLREATVAAAFEASGHGLHTAKPVTVRVSPAPAAHGVVFRRRLKGAAHDVPALWPNRRSRPLCTALQVGEGPLVRTVEHLLAALSAAAIDNALVELDAEELPILDGSAEPWCALIEQAGRVEQDRRRRYIRIRKRVRYQHGVHKQTAEPAPEFRIYSAVTLSHFGQLRWEGRIDAQSFRRELAASRSFGRLKWALPGKIVGFFRREPVLRGAHAGNTAALWGKDAIGGLRFPDEPVRHRALDLVGDLALAGMPIVGKMIAIRPGHEHNYGLLEALMKTPDAWDVVSYDETGKPTRRPG
ncbi:UDP-3-O-acyl-N-acetylglucosamine deacetylase [Chelatococcus sambhunathii]|uniref:UDP-3-O-acyl-N-acetylglucosamine deacetylase n=1 Tax=Chelatococcus sambhunathii TaxID=363953 RepID=A0ABU1DAB4_9HYPH|nr:UDP-3-O-acyl-N-acetylglucosamine deacetylase [Chelatococcus sambhunathii]MDR4305054.1 UDP-3-O-acyl-N-acetylglucosamine deacetylase [Chelatococcus sambhunathii]